MMDHVGQCGLAPLELLFFFFPNGFLETMAVFDLLGKNLCLFLRRRLSFRCVSSAARWNTFSKAPLAALAWPYFFVFFPTKVALLDWILPHSLIFHVPLCIRFRVPHWLIHSFFCFFLVCMHSYRPLVCSAWVSVCAVSVAKHTMKPLRYRGLKSVGTCES